MVNNKFTICKACKVLLKGTKFHATLKTCQVKPQLKKCSMNVPIDNPVGLIRNISRVIKKEQTRNTFEIQ